MIEDFNIIPTETSTGSGWQGVTPAIAVQTESGELKIVEPVIQVIVDDPNGKLFARQAKRFDLADEVCARWLVARIEGLYNEHGQPVEVSAYIDRNEDHITVLMTKKDVYAT